MKKIKSPKELIENLKKAKNYKQIIKTVKYHIKDNEHAQYVLNYVKENKKLTNDKIIKAYKKLLSPFEKSLESHITEFVTKIEKNEEYQQYEQNEKQKNSEKKELDIKTSFVLEHAENLIRGFENIYEKIKRKEVKDKDKEIKEFSKKMKDKLKQIEQIYNKAEASINSTTKKYAKQIEKLDEYLKPHPCDLGNHPERDHYARLLTGEYLSYDYDKYESYQKTIKDKLYIDIGIGSSDEGSTMPRDNNPKKVKDLINNTVIKLSEDKTNHSKESLKNFVEYQLNELDIYAEAMTKFAKELEPAIKKAYQELTAEFKKVETPEIKKGNTKKKIEHFEKLSQKGK